MTLILPQCVYCKHLDRSRKVPFCTAFPGQDGIPLEILRNEADHRKPFQGDHGTQFEGLEPSGAREVDRIFSNADNS